MRKDEKKREKAGRRRAFEPVPPFVFVPLTINATGRLFGIDGIKARNWQWEEGRKTSEAHYLRSWWKERAIKQTHRVRYKNEWTESKLWTNLERLLLLLLLKKNKEKQEAIVLLLPKPAGVPHNARVRKHTKARKEKQV